MKRGARVSKQKGRSRPLSLPFSVGSLDPSYLCTEMVTFSLPRFSSCSFALPAPFLSLFLSSCVVLGGGRRGRRGRGGGNYQGRGARDAGPMQVEGTGAQTFPDCDLVNTQLTLLIPIHRCLREQEARSPMPGTLRITQYCWSPRAP